MVRNPARRGQQDRNQPEIVKALKQVGASVVSTAAIGGGFPDLVVGFRGRNYLIEVKTVGGKLNPDQEKFHKEWYATVNVARTVDDALRVIGL